MTARRLTGCVLALGIAACGKKQDAAQQRAGQQGDRVIPVSVTKVEQKDFPVFLDGLGTVTAYKTVTVRSQVDGRLDAVVFREGQEVKKGEVLAQIDPRPFQIQLHQGEGALARDQAQLVGAQHNLARFEDLAKRKLIAQQQADDQRALVGQFEGAVRIDRAAIETARLNLAYARITSPIDGIAGIRNVDPGNLVHANDTTGIVTIAQLDPIAVIFTLPQDVLTQVSGQLRQGALEVRILARDGGAEMGRGRLEVIDNAINATTATLRLKAVLSNPQHGLWPNQFVKARLLLTTRQGAIVMPAAAVQRGPEGSFAYVVQGDSTVQPRPVQIELQQGDDAVVGKGVNVGDTVVTEGQNQLRPGSKVAARQPAQGRDGGQPPPREGTMPAASGQQQPQQQQPRRGSP
jgi:multidrug efflux system membrane fusion protein